MDLSSMLSKIMNKAQEAFNNVQIDAYKQVDNPFKGSVDASIFAGADINSFKDTIKSGLNIDGDESIFYQNIDEFGVEKVFDYFDKNGDGKIDDEEIRGFSSTDNNDKDISGLDLVYALNDITQKELLDDFDAMEKAGLVDREKVNNQAMQNYTAPIGGSNYQNYGSQTQNGSTISSAEQFSTKDKLEKIENEEIPALEEKKQQVIDKAQKDTDNKNKELDELLKDNEKALGKLGEDYSKKQDEIKECDDKIAELDTSISDSQSVIHDNESSVANLQAELDNLDCDTKDEKINAANKERKSEIEGKIKEAQDKISEEQDKIKEYEEQKKEQEELKAQKEVELANIQEDIEKKNPEIAEKMSKIQEELKTIEETKAKDVKTIDDEIKTKREEAIKFQKEIGEKTGQAESMTGSKMVQDALKLAEEELAKGVHEFSGNNDSPEIDKYRNGSANGQPWCASFVSWIYGAGQNSDNKATFGYDASVAGIRAKAESAGYYSDKSSYTPQAGDLMIQQNNASHVGVVKSVDPDGTIHTIEGNSSDKVTERTYAPGSSGYNKISGWVKMNEWLNK